MRTIALIFLLLALMVIVVACTREHETYTLKVCTRTMEKKDLDPSTMKFKSRSPKKFKSWLTVCSFTAGGGIAGVGGKKGKIKNNNEPGVFFDEEGKWLGEDILFENTTVKMACYPNQMNANLRRWWHGIEGYKGLCEIEYYKHPKFKWFEPYHAFGRGG